MMPPLGIIEGFFGQPWGWDERRHVVAALAPRGYGFYLYAPKADAFLRRRWQEPHPDGALRALADFAAFCGEAGVRFGIGLSPFELHSLEGEDWRRPLADKVEALNEIGADDLAILFDDMRGDVPGLAERQAAIVALAAERSSASRILCCPSYYSDDPVLDRVFGARPDDYLQDLGLLLDPAVEIMWTGEEVCAREYSVGHLQEVADRIGRRPFLWDNYPVNDGARMSQYLHLRAFTGRPAAIGEHISAHGINPALQPVLSLIPALTLAESYRAGDAYRYGAAFREAVREVLGDELAARVERDILTFQDRGRDRLSPERIAELREIYEAFEHPAAREVLAWLDGEFEVTDELVQTQ